MYQELSNEQKKAIHRLKTVVDRLHTNGGLGGFGDSLELCYGVGQLQATGLIPASDLSRRVDPSTLVIQEPFSAPADLPE